MVQFLKSKFCFFKFAAFLNAFVSRVVKSELSGVSATHAAGAPGVGKFFKWKKNRENVGCEEQA